VLRVAAIFSRVPVDVDGRAAAAMVAAGALVVAARLGSIRASPRRRNLRVDAVSSR
jgi:hypothetical protein